MSRAIPSGAGLAGAEAPEPPSRLGPTGGIPIAALLKLAQRCENAEGPDRRLLRDIVCEFGWAVRIPGSAADGSEDGWHDIERKLPPYPRPFDCTASLDAAETLVPDGYDWAVFRTNGGLTIHAWCGSREDVFAATPALALCAAALRALARIEAGTGETACGLDAEGTKAGLAPNSLISHTQEGENP